MSTRMMGKNFRLQPGREGGHGSECPICKPDDPLGRAAEKEEWFRIVLEEAEGYAVDRTQREANSRGRVQL